VFDVLHLRARCKDRQKARAAGGNVGSREKGSNREI